MTTPRPGTNTPFPAVWERFCSAPGLLGPTPGVRADWAAGRPQYAVWAIRIHAPAVQKRVLELQAGLTPWTRPIPAHDLHVTTWVAGFPSTNPQRDDDIHEQALAAQVRALHGQASFRLAIGGANSFTTAPFLEVYDLDGGLARMRTVLEQQGPRELRFAPYVPHVTLGTVTADHPVAPLRTFIEPHRQLAPIEVQVDCIEQLRFDAAQPGARLHTHHTVHLA